MIRLLFVAVMVVYGSLAEAHEGEACSSWGEESDKPFRETVLGDVFPLTGEIIRSELLVEDLDPTSPGFGRRVFSPLMEARRSLRESLSAPTNGPPPAYFDGPSNEIMSAPFDQLVQNDLLPSTMAQMRVPNGVVSTGSGIMYFGGIAFMR